MVFSSSHLSVDLHIHSTASDGTLSPAEILSQAAQAGLSAISITDHDTIDGVRAALSAGIPEGLGFISGVEISAAHPPDFPCRGSLHILGYGISVDHDDLNRDLRKLQNARSERNPSIVRRLNRLGIDITLEEVLEIAGSGQAGRPHIAEALIRKNYAADVDDAFGRYLGTGKPAYVDKYRIPSADAIAMIQKAGGAAVLAHPGLILPSGEWPLDAMITELKLCGLDGIEVFYPEHSHDCTRRLQAFAERLQLLITGGTDFHGDLKPEMSLGYASGGFSVPFSCFKNLESLVSRRVP